MIIWLALFLLVVFISFILAYQSMSDFGENPKLSNVEYGLYLIRKTSNLTPALLDSMHDEVAKEGLIISLERLFKGRKSALVIFGPKKVLKNYLPSLDLLELEDYTEVDKDQAYAWEVGVKNHHLEEMDNFFKRIPILAEAEQVWWQLTLAAKQQKGEIKTFQSQIRVVVLSADTQRRKKVSQILQNLTSHLTKIPRPFTTQQIVDFYQTRSFFRTKFNPQFSSQELVKLLVPQPLPQTLPQTHHLKE